MDFTNERMAHYYNKKRRDAPPFKEGEKVFLLRRNIKTKRPNDKLDHKKLGPFKIEKKIGKLSYRLKLPHKMRIYPVFHVSLLEKANQNAEQYRTEVEADEKEYEVERILGKQEISGKVHYLVKWKGYPTEENTWEPMEHLHNARKAVNRYQQQGHASTRRTADQESPPH